MPPESPQDKSDGEFVVQQTLTDSIYSMLRAIAQKQMANEPAGHTLGATALVHEAYIRFAKSEEGVQNDPSVFYRAAADAMRHILIDHARKRGAIKRGGGGKGGAGRVRILTNVEDLAACENPSDIVTVHEAFLRLESVDPRSAEVVKLRFYAGLSVQQTAKALQVSEETVYRNWKFAKTQLLAFLTEIPDDRT